MTAENWGLYMDLLLQCPLFKNITAENLRAVLGCLQVKTVDFEKNEYIYQTGSPIRNVGIILKGSACIEKIDCWGNRSILDKVAAGDMFGEALSCAEVDSSPVDVVAREKTTALFADYRKIITTCSSACVFHTALIENMLGILAGKNIMLTNKIEHITRRTTREKLLSYFSSAALKAGSRQFAISLNRQELADYLAVDRSAMSAELAKMKKDGILEYEKNRFVLHNAEAEY